MRATIHFSGEQIVVSFESEYAFVKWLGYLKDHGLASVKLAESDRSVIIFRDQVTYIESSSAELTLP